ncbi:MAG: protein kinase domain-containing protein [Dehalococcoidia bacterium]
MTQPPQAAANGPDRVGPGVRLADRYIVAEVVGYGGMSTVYRGRDSLLDRNVAIKVLNQRIATNDATDRQAFLREARAAASLSHPGIAATYDAGIFADWPFIVMEYVAGESLKAVLDAKDPIAAVDAIELTIHVAEALDYGHRHGVVHCDVKPQNILLDHEGRPKLVDFGISQTVAATAALTSTVSGTAGYVAPEQLEGLSLDGRADVYSLGTVFYQLLTRALPFEAPNLTALATRRLVAPPRPIRELNPAIPPDLAAIVMHCLERQREDRFASAGELAEALKAYVSGYPAQRTIVTRQPAPIVESTQVWRREASPVAPLPEEVYATGFGRSGLFWFVALVLLALLAALLVAIFVIAPGRGATGTAVVPQVTNSRLDQAAQQLQGAGLKIAVTTVDSPQPVGAVLNQDPAPNTTLSKKDFVTLTVSRGNAP